MAVETVRSQTLCGSFMTCVVQVGLPVSFADGEGGRGVEKEDLKSVWVIQTPSYSLKMLFVPLPYFLTCFQLNFL